MYAQPHAMGVSAFRDVKSYRRRKRWLAQHFRKSRAYNDDVLGDAYEYLMRYFTS